MVRFSEHQACIKALENALENNITSQAIMDALGADDDDSSDEADSDSSSDEEDLNTDLIFYLQAVHSQQYFGPRRRLALAPDNSDWLMNRLDDRAFKQEFRMSHSSFVKLVERISGDDVFQNNSNNPQRPVQEQLMISLKRFGCYGNGVAVGFLARFFRVGQGTIELYTNRCIMAILRLKSGMLKWPNADKRKLTQKDYADEGFDGCVGLIDGSLIPLFDAPSKNGSDYWSRKGFYAIATLLICDNNQNIIYIYTGWLGCSHDARLMSNASVTLTPEQFFLPGQYLLADSAFITTETVVSAFKRPPHGQLTNEQHRFNYILAQNCVQIECCIGALKGRFQSLKGLQLRIGDRKDQVRANAWIMACGVLHNFLNQGDDFDFEDRDLNPGVHIPESEFHSTNKAPTQRATLAGRLQREKIKAQALAFNQ
ncbi:hypothetical protein PSTG_11060 [Puccinia striiformis f. sp. tritici PST-78]|uniref:DDE Tnp4 domain-containing protein n=1 Tax=Puccinia striiformis f. sp. tritici PST-78 TaxID=1165861 RepID=A0A0L0V9B5_9BASI|nr:hypothetical protein PSTG_11060 [Puccinia striiformis f. sp. tritici PST-78]